MHSYTTVGNIYSLYPRVGSMSTINSASVAFYLDQAENEINGYLINNYTLPFSSTPPVIGTLSTEYGLVKILERFFTQETGSQHAWVKERKDYIFDYLAKLNTGDVGLFDSSMQIITWNAGDTIYSNTMTYLPAFNVLNEVYQQIDGDRLEDEWDDVRESPYDPNLG